MAKAKFNPSIEEFRGKIGKLVFRRTDSGKIIVTKCPDMSNVEWSSAQKAQRERIKQGTAYAKAAMADPKVRAIYVKLAAKAKKRPFNMAVSDYCNGKNRLSKT